MAFAAPQILTVAECLPLTLRRLGIADPLGTGNTAATSAPYTTAEIKTSLFQADFETATLICNSLENPYRTKFVTAETDYLTDGALVPAHTGFHSRVMVRQGTDNTTLVLGEARPFTRIKQIKRAAAIYGNPKNLYSISGGRIYFPIATMQGKLDIPELIRDTGETTMLCPLQYLWAVIARAIVMSANVGFPSAHREFWARYAMKAEQDIASGTLSIPEPEAIERIGA